MSYRGGFRGGRRPNRDENRLYETPPQSRVAEGSRKGAIDEPSMINLFTNSPNKHVAWNKCKKEFSDHFIFNYEYFVDIISTGDHHKFGSKPIMTREENDEILNITQINRMEEMAWQISNPEKINEFQAHGERTAEYIRDLIKTERALLDDSIKERRHKYQKELDDYNKNSPRVFLFILSKCSLPLKDKLSLHPDFRAQVDETKNPSWLWNQIEHIIIGLTGDLTLAGNAVNDQIIRMETIGLKSSFDARRQGNEESTEAFHNWFYTQRQGLKTVGIVIDEVVAATQFIEALCNNRFHALKDDLKNTLLLEEKNIYPKTVPDAYKLAMKYQQTPGIKMGNTNYVDESTTYKKQCSATNSEQPTPLSTDKVDSSNSVNYNYTGNKKSTPYETGKKQLICEHCGLYGHSMNTCKGKNLSSSEAKANAQKYLQHKKEKEEYRKSQLYTEDANNNTNSNTKKKEIKKTFFTQCDSYDGYDHYDDEITDDFGPQIICDTGSNVGLYCDINLVFDIRKTSQPLVIQGINNANYPYMKLRHQKFLTTLFIFIKTQ
jgi:hypothetical protein